MLLLCRRWKQSCPWTLYCRWQVLRWGTRCEDSAPAWRNVPGWLLPSPVWRVPLNQVRGTFWDSSMRTCATWYSPRVLYWGCFYLLWCRRWAEGRRELLAFWTHAEGQRLSTDRRSARKPGDSTATSQPLASRPSFFHSLHSINPLRNLPSSPLRLGVSGPHARGTRVVCAQRRPSHGSLPDAFSSHVPAPRTHFHPTHNSTIQEASPAKAPLHPATSVTQSAAPPPQHNPDAQQKPRISAGQPHRRPACQQVGVQNVFLAVFFNK